MDYEIFLWGLGQFFVVVSEWKQCSFVSWKQSWSRLGKSSASDASVSISFEVKLDIKKQQRQKPVPSISKTMENGPKSPLASPQKSLPHFP